MKKFLFIFAIGLLFMANSCTIKQLKSVPKQAVSEKITLAPPQVTLARKITVFFEKDASVKTEYDESTSTITIKTDTTVKANALNTLMGDKFEFGELVLNYKFVPGNGIPKETFTDDIHNALYGNKAFCLDKVVTMFGVNVNYIGFHNTLVQFGNDDISQYYLQWNGTYEDIAKTIFVNQKALGNVRFCTDIK